VADEAYLNTINPSSAGLSGKHCRTSYVTACRCPRLSSKSLATGCFAFAGRQ
jgi:hypothetical protein